jgi:hypothetical protein
MITTDGGITPSSLVQGDAVVVDIAIFDTSAAGTVALAQRRYISNNGRFQDNLNWSFTIAAPLAPGAHTISVGARWVASSPVNLLNVTVAGSAIDLNRGTLTVLQINK